MFTKTFLKFLLPISGGLAFSSSWASSQWIAMSSGHGCAVTIKGTAQCWGSRNNGQVGDGVVNNTPLPLAMAVLASPTNTATVVVGGLHSCLLKADGGVECWGGNFYKQLGNSMAPNPSPNRVAVEGIGSGLGQLPAKQITANGMSAHTCALIMDGTIRCWGRGTSGQLGNGTQNSAVPLIVIGIDGQTSQTTATAITGGGSHTCALMKDQTMKCWGRNNEGELGIGSMGSTPQPNPQLVTGLSNVTFIAAGGSNTCAIGTSAAGTGLHCWGMNDVGQVGDGTSGVDRPSPKLLVFPAGPIIAEVVIGSKHSCARTSGNQVYCWRLNGSGQLGDGSLTTSMAPKGATLVPPVRYLAAGGNTTCACRLSDDVIICWGDNTTGQLGNSTVDWQPGVVEVQRFTSSFHKVAAGKEHTCALTSNGRVHCWGSNHFQALGVSGSTRAVTPPIPLPSGVSSFVKVMAGNSHSCAIANTGQLYCWGYSAYGQLAGGNLTTPV